MREQRELIMYVVTEGKEEFEIVEDLEDLEKELKMVRIDEEDQDIVELLINYVVGLSNLGTMKVRGEIEGKEVVILVDYRATHNFIFEKLVKCLKDTSHYGVILGSDTTIKVKESVSLLTVNL